MPRETLKLLLRQHEIAWSLASYHLDGLSTEECLWRPSICGPHISQSDDGKWRGDWPEHEGYDLGPPSIAWLTWHIGFWWSMAIDHSFGAAKLDQTSIVWPGSSDGVRSWLTLLHDQWQSCLADITDDDLSSTERTKWPFQDKPFGDIVAWLNVELAKNASELGYARFLYATRTVA